MSSWGCKVLPVDFKDVVRQTDLVVVAAVSEVYWHRDTQTVTLNVKDVWKGMDSAKTIHLTNIFKHRSAISDCDRLDQKIDDGQTCLFFLTRKPGGIYERKTNEKESRWPILSATYVLPNGKSAHSKSYVSYGFPFTNWEVESNAKIIWLVNKSSAAKPRLSGKDECEAISIQPYSVLKNEPRECRIYFDDLKRYVVKIRGQ